MLKNIHEENLVNRESDLEYIKDFPSLINGHLSHCSGKAGPKILIIGATHGNEPSGVKGFLRLHKYFQKKSEDLLCGEVHFLIANPKAYIADTRYIDFDLNRTFNKNLSGEGYEFKRSKEISSFLKEQKFDIVLDIHSVSKGESQVLVYQKSCDKSHELADAISPIPLHLAYHSHNIEGLLIDEVTRLGGISLAVECGNHLSPNGPIVALDHIYFLLKYKNMMVTNKEWEEESSIYVTQKKIEIVQYETIEAVKPEFNFRFIRDDFYTGSPLKAGEVFAENDKRQYTAPRDCYLVMPPQQPSDDDYDAGFLCLKHIL